jgi:ketosteroid isomerase-like protein
MKTTLNANSSRIERQSNRRLAWNFAKMRILSTALFGVAALFMNGCRTSQSNTASAEGSIRALLDQQVRDWNAANLAGFMEGYDKSDSTRFASGGNVVLGWQTVFDRYRKRYADPAAMGVTIFSDLNINVLSRDIAMVVGHWHQKGANGEGSGVFTLVLRKTPVGWRIIHDHTSVAETK